MDVTAPVMSTTSPLPRVDGDGGPGSRPASPLDAVSSELSPSPSDGGGGKAAERGEPSDGAARDASPEAGKTFLTEAFLRS